VVNVVTVIATGVNSDGHREILGVDVITSEDGEGWKGFLRGLVDRGLSGVKLVISDAHAGLKAAIAEVLSGSSWQRCRTHFMCNLLTKVPKSAQGLVTTMVRSIFAQPSAKNVMGQHKLVVEQLSTRFPKAVWRQIWSNNPQKRLNREVRRRTDVVGIFPNRAAIIRLVGAVLAEQNDEWMITHRYMSVSVLRKAQAKSSQPQWEELSEPKEEQMLVEQLVA